MGNKYYAVKTVNGKKVNAIYTSWETCKSKVHKKNAVYKSFASQDEAKAFLGGGNAIKTKESKPIAARPIKRCKVCEKPHKVKSQLCPTCKTRAKTISKYPLSIGSLLYLKQHYRVDDILGYLEKEPWKVNALSKATKADRKYAKFENNSDIEGKYNSTTKYKKYESDIPVYVTDVVKKYPHIALLTIDGNKIDPMIYCQCKKCKDEVCFRYSKLKVSVGHNCSSTISSGEFAVQEFLKEQGIPYKVQRDTLECRNPKTGYLLPYDFELSKVKLIIEVHGVQHDKFVERFHGTIENFEYSQWKDQIKKEYAISKGYTLLEIRYPEIKDGSFKEKIMDCISKMK